ETPCAGVPETPASPKVLPSCASSACALPHRSVFPVVPGRESVPSSSMTCRATGQALNVVFLYELSSKLALVGGWCIAHLKHFFFGTNKHSGVAMAVQAPRHGEILGLPHQRHTVHAAVTGFTTDPFVYVNAVIEINELRQVVHPGPFDRFAAAVTLAYWF